MNLSDYSPQFHPTELMLSLVSESSELAGRIPALHKLSAGECRESLVRSVHASLAIEGNRLSLEQVRLAVDGKRIVADPAEILEVRNAFRACELIMSQDPLSEKSFLRAHSLMMNGLVGEYGKLRTCAVGVFAGNVPVHIAPLARLVPKLVHDLFAWYRKSGLPPLVKSAVFHYELEFIHPFADGNGRMGRLWHRLFLGQQTRLFLFIPADELILERRQDYYRVLGEADSSGDCTGFVEFMLEVIRDSIREVSVRVDRGTDQVSDQDADQDSDQVSDQVRGDGSSAGGTPAGRLLRALGNETLSAAELMRRTGLSHMPTFRKNYLNPALEQGLIERTVPDRPNSSRQKYRRVRKTADSEG